MPRRHTTCQHLSESHKTPVLSLLFATSPPRRVALLGSIPRMACEFSGQYLKREPTPPLPKNSTSPPLILDGLNAAKDAKNAKKDDSAELRNLLVGLPSDSLDRIYSEMMRLKNERRP